jgi:antitoxin PrlF
MSATLEVESTLTDRYQTTVPDQVRRALRLGKRDKIHYSIRSGGEVVLTRAEAAEGEDPDLGQFLCFLARDMEKHPERLQAVGASFVNSLHSLVAAITKLAFDFILQDPTRAEYRQGDTLGNDYKHWFPGQVLPAVPAVLSVSRVEQDDLVRVGK